MNLLNKIFIEYLRNDYVGLILFFLFLFSLIIWFFHNKSKIVSNIFNSVFKFLNLAYFNKAYIALIGLFIGFIAGIIGNLIALTHSKTFSDLKIDAFSHLNEAIGNTISYFALNTPSVNNTNFWIWLSYILISLIVSISAIILFLRKILEKNLAKSLMLDKNTIIFGYGDISKSFLDTYLQKKKTNNNIIVVDIEEKKFDDYYYSKGLAFLHGDVNNDDFFNNFDFSKTSEIIITLGDDKLNLDLAVKITQKLKNKKTPTKLILHLKNFHLTSVFFDDEFIEQKKDKIDLKIFSYPTEVTDDLFSKYKLKLLPQNNEYKVAIVGESEIALEIIKRFMINYIFDDNTTTKINVISNENFFKKILFITNYSEKKFPHIKFTHTQNKMELLKDSDFWSNFDDVIIVYENENKNLDFTFKLYKYVFSKTKCKTDIFFNIYYEYILSEKINLNSQSFNRFFAFGLGKDLFTYDKLINDEEFKIAKLINCEYEGGQLDEEYCNRQWYNINNLYKKLQNIAQYQHIDIKLFVLGLKKEKNVSYDFKKLSEINNEIFLNKIKIYLNNEKLFDKLKNNLSNKKELTEILKDEIYNNKNTKLINLLNLEHKRWMSYYFLEGWEYDKIRNENLKKHECLIDIQNFDENIRNKIIYDFQAIFYIPKYLSKTNFIIKEIDKNEF